MLGISSGNLRSQDSHSFRKQIVSFRFGVKYPGGCLLFPLLPSKKHREGSQLRLILMSFCLHLAQGKVTHGLLEVQSWMAQIIQIGCGEPWWLSVSDNLGSFSLEKTLEITESNHKLNTANSTTEKHP